VAGPTILLIRPFSSDKRVVLELCIFTSVSLRVVLELCIFTSVSLIAKSARSALTEPPNVDGGDWLLRPDGGVRFEPADEELDEEELDEEEQDEEERRRSFSSSLPLSLSLPLPSLEPLPLSVSSSDPSLVRMSDEAASQMASPPDLALKCALIRST
jgi:hypothetical protein